jgi:hypothetical protein
MLVLVPREEVGTVHVSPVPTLRGFKSFKSFPRWNIQGLLTFSEEGFLDTAGSLLRHERVDFHQLIIFLRDSVLVARVILLIISSDVFLA